MNKTLGVWIKGDTDTSFLSDVNRKQRCLLAVLNDSVCLFNYICTLSADLMRALMHHQPCFITSSGASSLRQNPVLRFSFSQFYTCCMFLKSYEPNQIATQQQT